MVTGFPRSGAARTQTRCLGSAPRALCGPQGAGRTLTCPGSARHRDVPKRWGTCSFLSGVTLEPVLATCAPHCLRSRTRSGPRHAPQLSGGPLLARCCLDVSRVSCLPSSSFLINWQLLRVSSFRLNSVFENLFAKPNACSGIYARKYGCTGTSTLLLLNTLSLLEYDVNKINAKMMMVF